MKPIALLGLIGAASLCAAQSNVKMFAATAVAGGAPQVRLRWQFESGWVPETGLKLYRVEGTKRDLVKSLAAPTDATVDGLFPPQFRGRKLWATATRPLPETVRIDFGIVRPPTSLPIFEQRKAFLDKIRINPGPMTPEERRRFSTLFQSPGSTRPQPGKPGTGGGATISSTGGATGDAELTRAARSELQLIALVRPTLADNLALGATDTGVKQGQKVSYQLVADGARGTERVLASVNDFVVGSDAPPPTPQGFRFLQDEETIGMRWDRLTVQEESRLLQASYEIARVDGGQAKDLTAKPVVILNLEGNKEPVSFFSDQVGAPGQVTYRVTLVDGFGRASQPGVFTVNVAEWRKPEPPSESAASLGSVFRRVNRVGRDRTGGVPTVQFVPQATIVWRPSGQRFQLPVKFNVYRFDLDNPSADAVKLTASPIDGSALPADTPAQVEEIATLLYGDRVQRLDDAIEAAKRRSGAGREQAIAIAEAKKKSFFASLGSTLKTVPALKYVDGSAARDKRYAYTISAIFPSISMESADVQAGVISIPDPTPPPAVSGITQKFTAAPAVRRVFEPTPARSKTKGFTAPAIIDRLTTRRKEPALRTGVVDNRLPLNLTLVPNDNGGSVDLSWAPLSSLKDVRYQVRRTFGNQSVEVGVTKPNTPSIRDTVPRTRARTYRYEVVAISRWNVPGPKASLDVQVPATIPPDTPNVLSARPGGEGQIKVAIEPHAADQGVVRYVVTRDGQQAGTINWAAAGPLEFVDSGLAPDQPHTYVVRAETGGGTKSPDSAPVKGTALKLTAAAPTGLQAANDPKGVRLTWTAPAGAVSYIVKRKQGTGTATVLAGKVTAANFIDVMAMRGRSYTYEVCAVDAAGNVSVAATTTITVP